MLTSREKVNTNNIIFFCNFPKEGFTQAILIKAKNSVLHLHNISSTANPLMSSASQESCVVATLPYNQDVVLLEMSVNSAIFSTGTSHVLDSASTTGFFLLPLQISACPTTFATVTNRKMSLHAHVTCLGIVEGTRTIYQLYLLYDRAFRPIVFSQECSYFFPMYLLCHKS